MMALSVRRLATDKNNLSLTLVAGGKGFGKITIPQIQKPGLALTGDTSNLNPGRVQVFGGSEMRYLKSLSRSELEKVVRKLGQTGLACIIVTGGLRPPPRLSEEADLRKLPLFTTPLSTSVFILRVTKYLEDSLTETTTVHGVFVDVFGIGILLIGKSGIGKSECGLELVMRGHRLVADDVVHIRKRGPQSLYGYGSELIKYHMEIRGLGVINIKDLFGVASVRDRKVIELVIDMVEWNPKEAYERLGVDEPNHEILGVKVPLLRIPVRPGRSLAIIIEVAARNQLLKIKGVYSARELEERLTKQLLSGQKVREGPERIE